MEQRWWTWTQPLLSPSIMSTTPIFPMAKPCCNLIKCCGMTCLPLLLPLSTPLLGLFGTWPLDSPWSPWAALMSNPAVKVKSAGIAELWILLLLLLPQLPSDLHQSKVLLHYHQSSKFLQYEYHCPSSKLLHQH